MMVKPITPEAYFVLCSSLAQMGCDCSYKSSFLKYWSQAHFCRPLFYCYTGLSPISYEEVEMMEDLCAWYQGLDCE